MVAFIWGVCRFRAGARVIWLMYVDLVVVCRGRWEMGAGVWISHNVGSGVRGEGVVVEDGRWDSMIYSMYVRN